MPVLFVTVGKPGHGKSYVSEVISDICSATHLQSDLIRQEEVADGEPTYSSEESHETYSILFDKAEKFLSSGNNVVLDATFNRKTGRDRAEKVARRTSSRVIFLKIECDEQTAKKRIRNRSGVSDADVDLYERFRLAPIEDRQTAIIDNSGSMSETKRQVEELVENFV